MPCAEVFHIRNDLREKVGPHYPDYDRLVTEMDFAVQDLSPHFAVWMSDEIEDLRIKYCDICEKGLNLETAGDLYRRCHDLKGLGSTLGYPVVTRIAASASYLLRNMHEYSHCARELVGAHVEAIFAAVRDQISLETNSTARRLVEELESQAYRHILNSSD